MTDSMDRPMAVCVASPTIVSSGRDGERRGDRQSDDREAKALRVLQDRLQGSGIRQERFAPADRDPGRQRRARQHRIQPAQVLLRRPCDREAVCARRLIERQVQQRFMPIGARGGDPRRQVRRIGSETRGWSPAAFR